MRRTVSITDLRAIFEVYGMQWVEWFALVIVLIGHGVIILAFLHFHGLP